LSDKISLSTIPRKPRKITWKILFICALSIPITFGLYIGGLSYSGYCFKEKRYISDEEKIKIVVAHVMHMDELRGHEGLEFLHQEDRDRELAKRARETPVNYKNMDEFFALNQSCCTVTRKHTDSEGETYVVGLWDRLCGFTSSLVVVKYLERYRDKKGVVHSTERETAPAISNCGHLWSGV